MGIKVLLADDSAAIKKVVQLCLQDFGLELKSTGNGKEVVELAKSFKPDIALIDVMLPHKTGYDVATEIKKDAVLQKTPIIMLWSSFMEFDEAKFKASTADAKLEKPFEANDLRELVKKLVPKTSTNPISSFVEIPKLDFKMPEASTDSSISKTNISATTPTASSAFKLTGPLADNEGDEAADAPSPTTNTEPGDAGWERKDISKFKVNIDSDGFEDNTVDFQYDESQIKDTSFIMKAEVGGSHGAAAPTPTAPSADATAVIPQTPVTPAPVAPTPAPAPTPIPVASAATAAAFDSTQIKTLLEKQVSDILQKEMRDILEKAIWKIVPDLASQIIKEEIARLTSEK